MALRLCQVISDTSRIISSNDRSCMVANCCIDMPALATKDATSSGSWSVPDDTADSFCRSDQRTVPFRDGTISRMCSEKLRTPSTTSFAISSLGNAVADASASLSSLSSTPSRGYSNRTASLGMNRPFCTSNLSNLDNTQWLRILTNKSSSIISNSSCKANGNPLSPSSLPRLPPSLSRWESPESIMISYLMTSSSSFFFSSGDAAPVLDLVEP
mmetsp:Transcript_36702/g.80315  ORF Transcript_36702/g.80315 Transcript_36702/m.80315 type:complete len:214 (-) Transcript_36702:1056-1697(-)